MNMFNILKNLIRFCIVALVVIILSVLSYFSYNLVQADALFRTQLAGGLLTTFTGALLGVFLGLEVNRFRDKLEKKRSDEKALSRANMLLELVDKELEENQLYISEMHDHLGMGKSARLDLWEHAETMVNSLSFNAYHMLIEKKVQDCLSLEREGSLHSLYQLLNRLYHRVRQAKAEHSYILGYSGNQERANKLRIEILSLAKETLDCLRMFRNS